MEPSVVFSVTVLRISSGVAVRNGSTFFFSMVTLRMRTGVWVNPSASGRRLRDAFHDIDPFGDPSERGVLAIERGLRGEAHEELGAVAIRFIWNAYGWRPRRARASDRWSRLPAD